MFTLDKEKKQKCYMQCSSSERKQIKETEKGREEKLMFFFIAADCILCIQKVGAWFPGGIVCRITSSLDEVFGSAVADTAVEDFFNLELRFGSVRQLDWRRWQDGSSWKGVRRVSAEE